jgi:hypothetical protein
VELQERCFCFSVLFCSFVNTKERKKTKRIKRECRRRREEEEEEGKSQNSKLALGWKELRILLMRKSRAEQSRAGATTRD